MEKPILFNDDMVRAIIGKRKTQTRRIIKPQPKSCLSYVTLGTHAGKWNYAPEFATTISGWPEKYSIASVPKKERENLWTPPCHADDVLYVREAWLQLPSGKYEYRTDYPARSFWNLARKWHPSIHMPKDAARIWLQVDSVSCQRLQEISEKEAANDAGVDLTDDPVDRFFDAWRKCYGEASIGENPYVWVISFHVISKP